MGGLFNGGHHAHRNQFAFPETQLHPRRARNRPSRHCRAGCRGSRAARSKEAKLSGPGMGTAPVLEYRGRGAWRRRGLGDFDTSHRGIQTRLRTLVNGSNGSPRQSSLALPLLCLQGRGFQCPGSGRNRRRACICETGGVFSWDGQNALPTP